MINCNIIIPTFNRPAYLRRVLSYYDSLEKKLKVIIADSSSNENKALNRSIISSISNLDIQYVDTYSTQINPHHKMADMVNYAQERYCVFCADDDFVTPNGIKQSVDFLEKNPDFAVAQGQYIAFYLEGEAGKKQKFYWNLVI